MNAKNRRVWGRGLLVALPVCWMLTCVNSVHAFESARAAFEGGRQASSSSQKKAAFSEGMSLAKARLDSNPNDAEGLFWMAVNMGAEALERGKMAALPVVPRMEALLLTLDRIDPTYEQAGASRVLGRLYHQAPAVISVGSNKEARKFLAKAVALAPNHPGNLAFSADFLVSHGDKSVARDYALRALNLLAQKDYGSEGAEWKELAQAVAKRTQ